MFTDCPLLIVRVKENLNFGKIALPRMLILSLFSALLQYAIYMNIGNQIVQMFYYF